MKKTILSLAMALLLCAQGVSTSYAHNENDSGEKSDGGSGDNGGTTISVTAADYDITTNSDNTVTFLRADGTPITNATVTVKSGDFTSGQEADIEMGVAMPATGIFDYSSYTGATNLRVTDTDTGATVQYMIETGEVEVSAGKNKSGDGSGGGTTAAETGSNMMYIGGGVVAFLAAATGFAVIRTKKKKAAFAAEQAAKKAKKSSKAKANA